MGATLTRRSVSKIDDNIGVATTCYARQEKQVSTNHLENSKNRMHLKNKQFLVELTNLKLKCPGALCTEVALYKYMTCDDIYLTSRRGPNIFC